MIEINEMRWGNKEIFADDLLAELAGRPCYFKKLYEGIIASRIIWRCEEFAVIPSIGQLSRGHILIVPNRPMAALAALEALESAKLLHIMDAVRRIYATKYGGDALYFEHGMGALGDGVACGVTQAHLHFVPAYCRATTTEFLKRVSSSQRQGDKGIGELRELANNNSYIYGGWLSKEGRDSVFRFRSGAVPSQYLRRQYCDVMGRDHWDWRRAGVEDEVIKTLRDFRGWRG